MEYLPELCFGTVDGFYYAHLDLRAGRRHGGRKCSCFQEDCSKDYKGKESLSQVAPSEGALVAVQSRRERAAAHSFMARMSLDRTTTVRLNVKENQLVNAFGEFGICLGGLKGA